MLCRFPHFRLLASALLLGGLAGVGPVHGQYIPSPYPSCPGEPAARQVTVDLNIIDVGGEMAERLKTAAGIDCSGCRKMDDPSDTPKVTFLDALEVRRLMRLVQSDSKTTAMQTPRFTVKPGKTGTVRVSDPRQFITGVECTDIGGQPVVVPKSEQVDQGFDIAVKPTVSADGQFIRVELNYSQSFLSSQEVPMQPVTTVVNPIAQGGNRGEPVTFTQYIQKPQVNSWKVVQTLQIADGRTAVLSGWTMVGDTVKKETVPVLSDIPFVGELFTTQVRKREPFYRLLLVTPRIQTDDEACKPQPVPAVPCTIKPVRYEEAVRATDAHPSGFMLATAAMPARPGEQFMKEVDREMARLLARRYQEACKCGYFEEARKLAEQAIHLDPGCFQNAP
jgi:Bacterial type II and III secretion system protein